MTLKNLTLLLFSCSMHTHLYASDDNIFLHFSSDSLQKGRTVWIENCKGCHAYGIAGAPVPMITSDWQARVIKPRQTLYRHAIEGFFGPDDTMMPERGGNSDLSDLEIMSAVDYMVALAEHTIRLSRKN